VKKHYRLRDVGPIWLKKIERAGFVRNPKKVYYLGLNRGKKTGPREGKKKRRPKRGQKKKWPQMSLVL